MVGPLACRTLADLVTTCRVGAWADSSTVKMAPLLMKRRKLKLVLFAFIILWGMRRRCKSNRRTTWVKGWIARRDEQGTCNNLIQELRDEDPTAWVFQFAPCVLVQSSPPHCCNAWSCDCSDTS